tara:strand:- start:1619 stop:2590 length:972 start_codon:yes stop_codon:yes gene_type:complete
MYKKIRSVVESDFLAVNDYIVEQLHSDVLLVENIGHYIVEAGGKRLRPILVLLAAHCCNIENSKHIPMAAVIEFIHTATLLHDDVVDMSLLRRGRPTVNSQWDNASSVLVGDFIYSRAFQILVDIGDLRVMEIIANTTNKIAEGEVLQLIAKNNPNSSEQNYLQVIKNKTAILFQAAAQCGAILGQADITTEKSLQHYGMHIGIAFQLIDDVLDYDGDTQTMGKNIGDDLAEGKPTLPLIYAMEKGDNDQSRKIKEVLQQKNVSEKVLHEVIQIVRESGALDYTRKLARQQAAAAMDSLKSIEKSAFREALISMAKFSLRRSN